jgi:AraC family transcriptional regulator
MPPGSASWSGLFVLDVGSALYTGPGLRASGHAHHAWQVCVGLEGAVALRTSASAGWVRHEGCVIAPEQFHEFDGEGRMVALLFLEPESDYGRRLGIGAESVAPLPVDRVESIRRSWAPRLAGGLEEVPGAVAPPSMHAMLAALGLDRAPRPLDRRLRRALAVLERCRHEYPSSAELAASLGLSPGRFRHLWLEELGLAYRRYLLWLRLRAVLRSTTRGRSLTEAAHEAGFADSAHLTRTFRRLLGVVPSALPIALRTEELPPTGRHGSSI